MPHNVNCRIEDRSDGLFDVVATIEPDKEFRRDGFVTLAEVDPWVEDLRFLMASLGAPVTQASTGFYLTSSLSPVRP